MTAATSQKRSIRPARPAALPFGEAEAWRAIGDGWRPLFGSFQKLGVSFEWHDFETSAELDWGRSFHPGSVEICLNLSGRGEVSDGTETASYVPTSAGFYCQGRRPLGAHRAAGEHHQFITVEFSPDFLSRQFTESIKHLHPLVAAVIRGDAQSGGVASASRLNGDQQQLMSSLQRPPVFAAAQEVWYHSKALELASVFFFQPGEQELFCDRQRRLSRERVDKVITLLKGNLVEPPALEEIGRQVGCSHFYLSRTFSQEMSMTIPQFLRQLRMERAAELLKGGKCNVTEAALEVGYNSLSHFSTAFHQTFGCCPGLYPLATPTQKASHPEK